jgi:hypothetical protein
MTKATVVVQTNFTFFDDNEVIYFPGQVQRVVVTELVKEYISLGMLRLEAEVEETPAAEESDVVVEEAKAETKKSTNVNKSTKSQTTDSEN